MDDISQACTSGSYERTILCIYVCLYKEAHMLVTLTQLYNFTCILTFETRKFKLLMTAFCAMFVASQVQEIIKMYITDMSRFRKETKNCDTIFSNIL
jgi:hypothetical protein